MAAIRGYQSKLWEVVETKTNRHRALQILHFSLPRVSNKKRTEILTSTLIESGAVGLVELINPRGIIRKPMRNFFVMLIFDKVQFGRLNASRER